MTLILWVYLLLFRHFTKRDNFCVFQCTSQDNKTFPKKGLLLNHKKIDSKEQILSFNPQSANYTAEDNTLEYFLLFFRDNKT